MIRFLGRWTLRLLVLIVALSLLVTLPLRWMDPATSAFMERERWTGEVIYFSFTPLENLPPYVPLAIIAAEDQNFPSHRGFDLGEIRNAVETHRAGGRLRGASTLSQQLARNLYLWPGRNWVRKGLESWLTGWLELTLPKRRILELHLNLAEFGPGIYGIEAAARHHFGKPAAALTRAEAALLAGVLPAPKQLDAARPGPHLASRQQWILAQMGNLGDEWVPR